MPMNYQSSSAIVGETILRSKARVDLKLVKQIEERLGVPAPEITFPLNCSSSNNTSCATKQSLPVKSCSLSVSTTRAVHRPRKKTSKKFSSLDLQESDSVVKGICEQAVVNDPFVFTEEMDNLNTYKPLKRKSPYVSTVGPKKSKLDSLFDSVFPPKHHADVVKDVNKENNKLNSIFDSVLGKLKKSTKDDLTNVLENSVKVCSAGCLNRTCFNKDSVSSVKKTQLKIKNMSTKELHIFLLERINIQSELGLETSSCFFFEKISFCHKAIISIFGISQYMIKTVLEDHLAGQTRHIHGNKGLLYASQKRDHGIGFVNNFSRMHAENLPDRTVLRLPHYLNIQEIYCYYKENVAAELQLKERSFYELFKKHFGDPSRKDDYLPRIIFMSSNTHPVCSECDRLTRLRKSAKSESEVQYALSCKTCHVLKVRRQYLQFVYRRELAARFPGDYLHIGKIMFHFYWSNQRTTS